MQISIKIIFSFDLNEILAYFLSCLYSSLTQFSTCWLSGNMLVVNSWKLKLPKEGYVHIYSYNFQITCIHFHLWRDVLYYVFLHWFLSCSGGDHFPIIHSSVSIYSFQNSYFNGLLQSLERTGFHVHIGLSPWFSRLFLSGLLLKSFSHFSIKFLDITHQPHHNQQ